MTKRRLPSNWRSRIEIIREDNLEIAMGRGRFRCDPSIRFTLTFKKGRTPKGFRRLIGDLVITNKSPYFVEGAEIDEYFVRRGLGTLLYRHALKKLGSLTTNYPSASVAAQGLWKSLTRAHHFKTDFFEGELTVFKRQVRRKSVIKMAENP